MFLIVGFVNVEPFRWFPCPPVLKSRDTSRGSVCGTQTVVHPLRTEDVRDDLGSAGSQEGFYQLTAEQRTSSISLFERPPRGLLVGKQSERGPEGRTGAESPLIESLSAGAIVRELPPAMSGRMMRPRRRRGSYHPAIVRQTGGGGR